MENIEISTATRCFGLARGELVRLALRKEIRSQGPAISLGVRRGVLSEKRVRLAGGGEVGGRDGGEEPESVMPAQPILRKQMAAASPMN